jgi:hypothetical protein
MTMTLKDALKRIEELERKVRELEARPAQQMHYHYYWQQPVYQQPILPQPWIGPGIVCGSGFSYGPDN